MTFNEVTRLRYECHEEKTPHLRAILGCQQGRIQSVTVRSPVICTITRSAQSGGVPRMTPLETPFTAVLFCVGLATLPSRGTSECVFSASIWTQVGPKFNWRKCALPGSVGAEEVFGRGEEI